MRPESSACPSLDCFLLWFIVSLHRWSVHHYQLSRTCINHIWATLYSWLFVGAKTNPSQHLFSIAYLPVLRFVKNSMSFLPRAVSWHRTPLCGFWQVWLFHDWKGVSWHLSELFQNRNIASISVHSGLWVIYTSACSSGLFELIA